MSLADSINKKYKSIFYVYLYLDPVDLQPFYVGKGKGKRAWQHLKFKGHTHFLNKVRRIQEELGIDPVVVIYQDNLLEQDAFELENELIKFYGRENNSTGCLCNLTDGGEGTSGHVVSEEERKKRSAHRKGIPRLDLRGIYRTVEQRYNMSIAHIGKTLPEEQKIKMRNAHLGEKNHFYGKKHSPETVEIIRNKNKGRKHTKEELDKMIKAHTGLPCPEERKIKISNSLKGKPFSEERKKNIKEGVRKYWDNKKKENN